MNARLQQLLVLWVLRMGYETWLQVFLFSRIVIVVRADTNHGLQALLRALRLQEAMGLVWDENGEAWRPQDAHGVLAERLQQPLQRAMHV